MEQIALIPDYFFYLPMNKGRSAEQPYRDFTTPINFKAGESYLTKKPSPPLYLGVLDKQNTEQY